MISLAYPNAELAVKNGYRPRALQRRKVHQRSGLLLVAALVCLLVITSMLASMLQNAMRSRRELRTERDRRQAELLLDAGAGRAAARLADDPAFQGDTWEVPGQAIVGNGDGRVTTEVSREPDGVTIQMKVVAEYPLGRSFSIRRSRTFEVAAATVPTQE
jgi:hypothetical protein